MRMVIHARANRSLGVLVTLSCLLTLALAPGSAAAAPIPSLATGAWSFNANGSTGTLAITAIDPKGNLSGTALGVPIKGFWNGFARSITFETSDPSFKLQVYTGYLYTTPAPPALIGGTGQTNPPKTYMLAGSYEAFTGTGGTAERSVFGWTATLSSSTYVGTVEDLESPVGLPPTKVNIIANGYLGELNISAVDAAGNVSGTLFGDQIIGFWDGYEQKLTLLRFASLTDATVLQVYTGYRYTDPRNPPPYLSVMFAGHFEAFTGTGATARRSVFGWNAYCPKAPC